MKNLKVKLRKQTFYSIINNKMFGSKFNQKNVKPGTLKTIKHCRKESKT